MGSTTAMFRLLKKMPLFRLIAIGETALLAAATSGGSIPATATASWSWCARAAA